MHISLTVLNPLQAHCSLRLIYQNMQFFSQQTKAVQQSRTAVLIWYRIWQGWLNSLERSVSMTDMTLNVSFAVSLLSVLLVHLYATGTTSFLNYSEVCSTWIKATCSRSIPSTLIHTAKAWAPEEPCWQCCTIIYFNNVKTAQSVVGWSTSNQWGN